MTNERRDKEKNQEEMGNLQRMPIHSTKQLKFTASVGHEAVTRINTVTILRVPNGLIYDFGGGSTQFVPFKVTTLII